MYIHIYIRVYIYTYICISIYIAEPPARSWPSHAARWGACSCFRSHGFYESRVLIIVCSSLFLRSFRAHPELERARGGEARKGARRRGPMPPRTTRNMILISVFERTIFNNPFQARAFPPALHASMLFCSQSGAE